MKFRALQYITQLAMLIALAIAMLTSQVHAAGNETIPVIRGEIVHDYARATFEWPENIKFTATANGNVIKIIFERPLQSNFGDLLSSLYPYITSAENKNDGKTVILTLNKPYQIRTFQSGDIGGIDLLHIDPKERLALREAAPIQLTANQAATLAPSAGEAAPKSDAETTITPPPTEAPAHSESVKVNVSDSTDSAVLRLPFTERMALAVFVRNNYLWIVLNRGMKFDLSDFDNLSKTVIGKAEILPGKNAVLRVPVDDNIYASVARDDTSFEWAILLTSAKRPPVSPLHLDINTDPPAPANVFIPSLEMSDPVTLRDPVIGDEIVAIPLYKTGEALSQARDFIEFTALSTAQGVAIAKKADDLTVSALRNGMRISTPQGTTLTPGLPPIQAEDSTNLQTVATLFPYEKWQLPVNAIRRVALKSYFQNIIDSPTLRGSNEQRIKLAQIYLGEGFAAEALGMLDGVSRTEPSFYRSSKLAALHGAANFLMYRFSEAARDFSASELNNNKEIDFWRNMISEILGTPGKFEYLAMNDDYISKYPPLFRQRIAVIAANHAIDTKDYNSALQIFDTLQPLKIPTDDDGKEGKKEKAKAKAIATNDPDDLTAPIKPYVNYLFAKISTETGQAKEGVDMWEELAKDSSHPFVQARAEFSLIIWQINHDGLRRDQAIDRLERLRLNWHGDSLELKTLELLGDLYNENKDYVNAMRIWEDGVTAFPSTPSAIEMAHKMQDTFAQMFSDEGSDAFKPLNALTLYYQFKSYAPSGSAGRNINNRLADRLVAIDLLQQAATLLDHQMRYDADKIQRSRIGEKIARIYLLAHEPQKALQALQDSVYGENPSALQQSRNRLTAETLFELNDSTKAALILGRDDSIEAERIRLNIFWQKKDWPHVITTVEGMLKQRKDANAPVELDESEDVIKLALAYVFQNDTLQLQYLHDYFGPLMAKNPNKPVFDFVTSSDITPTPTNFNEVIQRLSDTKAFIEKYHARIQTAGLDTATPKVTAKP